jgi:gliding motility-associated-like protein
MVKNYSNFLQLLLFFVFLLILPSQMFAQCAGDDAQKVICDIQDPAYKNLSLFGLLGGSPTPGGTWSDDNDLIGLYPATGILDAQLISSGGVYHYTYTVPSVAGCVDNSAVVTLIIASYAGVGSEATVCSDALNFNLFTAFDSRVMFPHDNGKWTDLAGHPTGAVIQLAGMEGTSQFIYTVPAVLDCTPTDPSTVVSVTVKRAAQAGKGSDLELCGTTDLSPYTNLDLHDLVTGEDMGGEWSGPGITSKTDHIVNLQDIFDIGGPRVLNYSYTVLAVPKNSICKDKTSWVSITLEKRIDFTGSRIVVNKDICESEMATAIYSAKITQGPDGIPDGEYNLSFTVDGPNGLSSETIKADFINGNFSFVVDDRYFRKVGKYNVSIRSIVPTFGKGLCVNIFSPFSDDVEIVSLPRLEGAFLLASPVCQNEEAVIQISNATRLADGKYTIVYHLSGANAQTGQTATFTAVGGEASFKLTGAQNVKSGISNIAITNIINISNPILQCSNTANLIGSLIINPLPNAATVKIQVGDYCFNEVVPVAVSGLGSLTDATLFYLLSGANSSAQQTVALTITNGNASFVIPQALLVNTGSITVSASYLKNNNTGCGIDLSNVSDGFLINPIPAAPTVVSPQDFCKVEEATLANLTPNGSQYKWYSSATSTVALANSYVLQSENLYVRETSLANCTSAPTMVSVVIKDIPAPTLNTGGADFCALKNPTISDLSKVTNVPNTVAWYDAENKGNLLASNALLSDKTTYYGFDFSALTDCISDDYLKVTVSLFDCDPADYTFFIPDGFSPNGDNVNDTFRIPDIEFLFPDYTLEIFNRYGNLMFKGNSSKPNWDGKNAQSAGFGDGIAPNGVYFYSIHFNKGNTPPRQGRLYLNR